ncbi:short chain dehydrogenase reductase [Exophiala viscosa]|uniref:Short chain dehydrogenase reductase n=1 Tax=Exophiala viscosa TaxID=2486360 RepID=A0AAN6DW57_9EURO|nr:short chain dehydrogenase reductase [Exophiala viscosa]
MAEELHTGFYFTPTLHKDTYPAIDPTRCDLSGKYVFITGASKGIGRATALSFARAGCSALALGARSDLSEVEELVTRAATEVGKPVPKILIVKLDVADQASVDQAVAKISSGFGRLDILINNAGYLEKRAKIADSDPSEWWKTWSVNVLGPYLVTRASLPLMLGTEDSSKIIVNLCSLGAHLLAPGASAYQPSKLAVLRWTEFLDVDHRSDGVLTFALHPGGVLTDMGQRLPIERQSALTETPELAAHTLVFLTEKRREWLAGRYIAATWDMPEFLAKKEEVVSGDKLKVRMVV